MNRLRRLVSRTPWSGRNKQLHPDQVAGLEARLAELCTSVERLGAEVHSEVSFILESLETRIADPPDFERIARSSLRPEFDRLDRYLNYHAASLRSSIARIEQEAGSLGSAIAGIRQRLPAPTFPTGPDLGVVLMEVGFGDLVVPSREIGTIAHLLRHGLGGYEPGVRAVITANLKPGDRAVDVGANIGVMTLTALHAVGREGHVIAFEPVPHIREALHRTALINGYTVACEIRPEAVAAAVGTTTFHVAEHGPESSLSAMPSMGVAERLTVPVVTLDAAIPSGDAVALVKVDAEGEELPIWRGSARLRADNPAIVYVLEWSSGNAAAAGHDLVELYTEIRSEDFEVMLISDSGDLSTLADSPQEWTDCNVLVRRPAEVRVR